MTGVLLDSYSHLEVNYISYENTEFGLLFRSSSSLYIGQILLGCVYGSELTLWLISHQ